MIIVTLFATHLFVNFFLPWLEHILMQFTRTAGSLKYIITGLYGKKKIDCWVDHETAKTGRS